jgi:hypothetical protein
MRWTIYLGTTLTALLSVGCGAVQTEGFGSHSAAETIGGTPGDTELDVNRRQQTADLISRQQAATTGDDSSASDMASRQRQQQRRVRQVRHARPIDHRPRRPDPDPHPYRRLGR